ncbi:MAG: DUF4386 domain-containing protein [Bacteroidales bacterium]|nr:DUF4386 domain-containing protein [Bacteroidales bacterium]MCF8387795.1 DUF4386 domain-containing protein [Bacteroidales bacterium]MCF8398218.1 DUF4386 domain-containing protein [Bacteroidales bacterium]
MKINTTSKDISSRNAAFMAGIAYFIMFIAAIFSNFIVRGKMILADNPTQSLQNITNNEMPFRISIVSDFLFVLPFDVLLALTLYVFLKPVNKSISLLAAWFRVVYTGIYAIALLFLIMILPGLNGLEESANSSLVSVFCLKAFNLTWLVGFIFFGFHLLLLGYLALKSGFIPKVIGWLLVLAAITYFFDNYANILLPNYQDFPPTIQAIVAIPEFIGELVLILWIFIKGTRINRPE